MTMEVLNQNGNVFTFAVGSDYGPNRDQVKAWGKDILKTDRVFVRPLDGMLQRWQVDAF